MFHSSPSLLSTAGVCGNIVDADTCRSTCVAQAWTWNYVDCIEQYYQGKIHASFARTNFLVFCTFKMFVNIFTTVYFFTVMKDCKFTHYFIFYTSVPYSSSESTCVNAYEMQCFDAFNMAPVDVTPSAAGSDDCSDLTSKPWFFALITVLVGVACLLLGAALASFGFLSCKKRKLSDERPVAGVDRANFIESQNPIQG